MVQSTQGLGLGVNADRPDVGHPSSLPRRRRAGPRRRGAAALRRPQLAADRHVRRAHHVLPRRADRRRRRLLRRPRRRQERRACSTSSGRSPSTSSRSASTRLDLARASRWDRCTSPRAASSCRSRSSGLVYIPYVARPIRGEVLSLQRARVRRGRDRARSLQLAPALERHSPERRHDGHRAVPVDARDQS